MHHVDADQPGQARQPRFTDDAGGGTGVAAAARRRSAEHGTRRLDGEQVFQREKGLGIVRRAVLCEQVVRNQAGYP